MPGQKEYEGFPAYRSPFPGVHNLRRHVGGGPDESAPRQILAPLAGRGGRAANAKRGRGGPPRNCAVSALLWDPRQGGAPQGGPRICATSMSSLSRIASSSFISSNFHAMLILVATMDFHIDLVTLNERSTSRKVRDSAANGHLIQYKLSAGSLHLSAVQCVAYVPKKKVKPCWSTQACCS